MHLARYRDDGEIHVGVIVDDELGAVGSLGLDLPDDIPAILASGSERREQLARQIARSASRQPLAQVELLTPIPRPGKFLAAGMNCATHAAELRDPPAPAPELTAAVEAMRHVNTAYPSPPIPTVFNKQTSCVSGPHDDIWAPADAESLDYEGELCIVIGRRGRR